MDTLLEQIIAPGIKQAARDTIEKIYRRKPCFCGEFVDGVGNATPYAKMIRAFHYSQRNEVANYLLANLNPEGTEDEILSLIEDNAIRFLKSLFKDPRFSSPYKTELFQDAVYEGWLEIIQILLEDAEVDVSRPLRCRHYPL